MYQDISFMFITKNELGPPWNEGLMGWQVVAEVVLNI